MAAGDSPDPEPGTPNNAKTSDRVRCVLRAAGLESTPGIQARAYQFLVGPDQDDGDASRDPSQPGKGSFQTRPRSLPVSAASEIHDTRVENGTLGTVSPAMTTKSYPAGRPASRMASRSLLLARLRTTALPIRRPVTSPNRTFPGCPTARTITKSPTRRRRPVARTVRKLAEERSETGLSGETLAAFCTP